MSMDYVKTHYRVPAKRGAKVIFEGNNGIITGARGAYLKVRIGKLSQYCHPLELDYIHSQWDKKFHK